MTTTNSPEQEAGTRHAALFASLLAVVNACDGRRGYQAVEITETGEVRLITRYHAADGVYQITQTVRLETRAKLL